ncbi:MAG: putative Na+/H+ antiporter [Burkholderiaceae bacterium]|nr:putative Na+/H+ antiporter [Burkholderiaceae bacterium]
MHPTSIELLGAILFGVAVLHTFSTGLFERLAHRHTRHAGIFHLLGEVEVVFGFWAMVLMLAMFAFHGKAEATHYLDSRNFTEPMFVFAIMVIAGTRPILQCVARSVGVLARGLPLSSNTALYLVVLTVVPLLGSFITEPAAMTLAALMLRENFYRYRLSSTMKYATLGTLFVNVSIGGTLTTFAAPPVLMVATKWGWDGSFMLATFGWKAAIAIVLNAALMAFCFRQELASIAGAPERVDPVPLPMVMVHLAFLALVVLFSHHPAVFMGAFLFFLGFVQAYPRHQDPLILKEALLVAFFLAGLVVLGGQQAWWLEPLLLSLNEDAVFYGTAALTAVTDNAALTYLASLVEGLTPQFQVALVAGAVAGGGLTVIANAPNPAGAAILRGHFDDAAIRAEYLLLGAVVPTVIAAAAFRLL